jgi:hypothetical protein
MIITERCKCGDLKSAHRKDVQVEALCRRSGVCYCKNFTFKSYAYQLPVNPILATIFKTVLNIIKISFGILWKVCLGLLIAIPLVLLLMVVGGSAVSVFELLFDKEKAATILIPSRS